MVSLWKEVLTNVPKECQHLSQFFQWNCSVTAAFFCVSPGESCDLLQHHVYFRSKRIRFEGRFPLVSLTKALLKIHGFPSRKVGHTGILRYRTVWYRRYTYEKESCVAGLSILKLLRCKKKDTVES